nr:hypothetical protein CFP56_09250 [Quercus suber]
MQLLGHPIVLSPEKQQVGLVTTEVGYTIELPMTLPSISKQTGLPHMGVDCRDNNIPLSTAVHSEGRQDPLVRVTWPDIIRFMSIMMRHMLHDRHASWDANHPFVISNHYGSISLATIDQASQQRHFGREAGQQEKQHQQIAGVTFSGQRTIPIGRIIVRILHEISYNVSEVRCSSGASPSHRTSDLQQDELPPKISCSFGICNSRHHATTVLTGDHPSISCESGLSTVKPPCPPFKFMYINVIR